MSEFNFAYNNTISQSYQGQLASQYTNWLTTLLIAAADSVGYEAFQQGGDVDTALAVKEAVASGNFTLSDVFSAAQSKLGPVDGGLITDPEPKLTVIVAGVPVVIDLSDFLSGTETANWTETSGSGKKATVSNHTREFYGEFDAPDAPDDWWVTNTDPTAEAQTFNLDEDDVDGPGFSYDLLDYASDVDGDTLTIDGITVTIDGVEMTTLPDFLSIVDGVVTVDTSHADLQPGGAYDLLFGETLPIVVSYGISDGNGGSTTNTVTINIAGALDEYTVTDVEAQVFTKLNSSAVGESFVGSFDIYEGGSNYSGTITITGLGDFDAATKNAGNPAESVTVGGEIAFYYEGTSPSTENEKLDDSVSGTLAIGDTALSDGSLDFTVDFSKTVQKDSSITVDLDYSYWA